MIEVTLYTAEGALRHVESHGHAPATGGMSVVCAAVTALLRSAAKTLADSEHVVATGSAPEPGQLSLSIIEVYRNDWHRGVGDMLISGLRQIECDHPDQLRVNIVEISQENS